MDAESQSEEELQSLTASHTPSYDATRTHFTNVQIDLIPPGHDDCRSERSPPSLGTSESNNRSGYLSTGNVNGSSIGMQEPASPQGNGSSQAFQPPPSIPQFSYYRYEHRPKASPPSSGDETYNSFSTTCSGSKRAARERSPVALLVGEKVTKEQSSQTMTVGTRHRMESSIHYHYFSPYEDFDNAIIHVQKSFAPANMLGIPFLFRLFFCYLSYRVLKTDYYDSIHIKESNCIMYFSHLTNMTLTLSVVYQFLSSFLSILALIRRKHYIILHQPKHNVRSINDGQLRPGALVCFTWLLYTIVLPGQFLVAFGYWSFDYTPDELMTFINLYKHAYIGVLLLLDGLIIARIPLRVKQWKGVFIYGIVYLLWSIVFSYYKMGKNNGIIYEFIDWRGNPHLAAAIFFLLVFVMAPFVFYMCWLVSVSDGICCLGCCSFNGGRRHIYSKDIVRVLNSTRAIDSGGHLQLQ